MQLNFVPLVIPMKFNPFSDADRITGFTQFGLNFFTCGEAMQSQVFQSQTILQTFRSKTPKEPGRYSQPRDAPPARVVILDGDVPLVFEFMGGKWPV